MPDLLAELKRHHEAIETGGYWENLGSTNAVADMLDRIIARLEAAEALAVTVKKFSDFDSRAMSECLSTGDRDDFLCGWTPEIIEALAAWESANG